MTPSARFPPMQSLARQNAAETDGDYDLEVFFDADCPLCRREIDWLRRRDRHSRVRFTDLTQIDYDADKCEKSFDELMAEIHGRLPNGTWITGVEVFRQLYSAVGMRWLVLPTRLPIVSHILEWGYRLFAKNRLRLTGRCNGACRVPKQLRGEVRS